MASARCRLFVSLVGAVLSVAGCGAEEGPGPPSVRISADPTTFASGGTTTLRVDVENFALRPPVAVRALGLRTAHGGDLHEGVPPLTADGGHYHVYLDTTSENPIRQAWAPVIDLMVTADPGPHRLYVRLSADDHRFLNPEVIDAVDIVLE